MIGRSCCRSLLGLQPWLQWENTKINAFFPHNCCFSLKNAVLVTRWSLLWSDLGCSPPNISGLAHLFYCIKDSGSWPSTCVGDFSCHQNIDCLILQRKKSLWFENKGSQRKLNQPDSKTSKRQCKAHMGCTGVELELLPENPVHGQLEWLWLLDLWYCLQQT